MVQKEGETEFDEVKLPAAAVHCLQKMNEKKRDEKYDCSYLKALLVGFCTMKGIKNDGGIIDKYHGVITGKIIHLKNYVCLS